MLITQELLDEVAAEAAASPRRRKNRNFHRANEDAAHRLLNALEPDSYVMPHRHLDPSKDETIVAVRGRFGLVLFGDDGQVQSTAVLAAGGKTIGVDIPHGTFHTLVALEPGSIFFEAKAGPYVAIAEAERAHWAPAEGTPEAKSYLERMRRLFN
ncbi:MAG TPA: WbuC family cupin fold metalloprotein [Burkholderiales bacterium]|nr:WbuC family cupin fold metalloprotein [Burkholderiales bacterium]